MLSVSGKGRRRRERGERREGGRWREVEEGGGGRGRTESHSFKLFGLGGVHAFNCALLSALTCIS